MPRTTTSPAGFTLIELLVVVSILAVLSAMLMPTIRTVREAALTSRCQSNLRQIHVALELYANDQDGLVARSNVEDGQFWFEFVAPYFDDSSATPVKGSTVQYHSIRARAMLRSCPVWTRTANPDWKVGYGINSWLKEPVRQGGVRFSNSWLTGGSAGWNGIFSEFHVASISMPSQRPQVTDANNWILEDAPRHVGRTNVLFCDGHVASLATANATPVVKLYINPADPTVIW